MSRRILARLEESIVLLTADWKELQHFLFFSTTVHGYFYCSSLFYVINYFGSTVSLLRRSAWEEESSHFVTSSEIPTIRSSEVLSSNLIAVLGETHNQLLQL
jgi:hypothetical protein